MLAVRRTVPPGVDHGVLDHLSRAIRDTFDRLTENGPDLPFDDRMEDYPYMVALAKATPTQVRRAMRAAATTAPTKRRPAARKR